MRGAGRRLRARSRMLQRALRGRSVPRYSGRELHRRRRMRHAGRLPERDLLRDRRLGMQLGRLLRWVHVPCRPVQGSAGSGLRVRPPLPRRLPAAPLGLPLRRLLLSHRHDLQRGRGLLQRAVRRRRVRLWSGGSLLRLHHRLLQRAMRHPCPAVRVREVRGSLRERGGLLLRAPVRCRRHVLRGFRRSLQQRLGVLLRELPGQRHVFVILTAPATGQQPSGRPLCCGPRRQRRRRMLPSSGGSDRFWPRRTDG